MRDAQLDRRSFSRVLGVGLRRLGASVESENSNAAAAEDPSPSSDGLLSNLKDIVGTIQSLLISEVEC